MPAIFGEITCLHAYGKVQQKRGNDDAGESEKNSWSDGLEQVRADKIQAMVERLALDKGVNNIPTLSGATDAIQARYRSLGQVYGNSL